MASAIGNLVVRLSSQTRGFERGMRRARGMLGSLGGLARKVGGMMATYLGPAVLAGGLLSAAHAGETFNQKMRQSLAIMGDVSVAMRRDMKAAALDVASTTRFAAHEAAEAYYFLASAGMNARQAIAALPQVAAFAQAGNFDLATATDLATDAQSALGLTVNDVARNLANLTRVTDVLIKANTLANASAQQFSEALTNKAATAMKMVGMEIEEGVAVLAAWADKGLKAADAGTAFNIVLRDLQTKALRNKKVFALAGVAVFDAADEFRNMADIVQDLEGYLHGMSDAQKKTALLAMGFADKSVIMTQSLIGLSDKIRQYEADLWLAGGTTREVAAKQLTPFQRAVAILGRETADLGTTLVRTFGPALYLTMRALAAVARTIGNLLGLFVRLGIAAVALKGYLIVLKLATLALGKATVMVTAVVDFFWAVVYMGPAAIAKTIIAIGIMTAAVVATGKAWDAATESIDNGTQSAQSFARAATGLQKLTETRGWAAKTPEQKTGAVEQQLGGLAEQLAAKRAVAAKGKEYDITARLVELTERQVQARKLLLGWIKDGVVTQAEGLALAQAYQDQLDRAEQTLKQMRDKGPARRPDAWTMGEIAVRGRLLKLLGDQAGAEEFIATVRQQLITPTQQLLDYERKLVAAVNLGMLSQREAVAAYRKMHEQLGLVNPAIAEAKAKFQELRERLYQLRHGLTDTQMEFIRLGEAAGLTAAQVGRLEEMDRQAKAMERARQGYAKAADAIKDLQDKLYQARSGASDFAMKLRDLARQPGVTQDQLRRMIEMQEELERIEHEKRKTELAEGKGPGGVSKEAVAATGWGTKEAWSAIQASMRDEGDKSVAAHTKQLVTLEKEHAERMDELLKLWRNPDLVTM